MKRKRFVLLLHLVLFAVIAQAQDGSAVYKRLERQYENVYYYDHWGKKYCYGIEQNGFEGCCDRNGNVIVPPTKYTNVSYDKDDNMFRVKIGDKLGILNEKGKVLVEADKYTQVYWDEDDKMFRVKNDDKAGMLDEKGNVLVEADKYTEVYWDEDDKMFRVKNGDKAGLLDEKGKVLVEADKYTEVYWDENDKMFRVKNGDKAGLLDEKGNVLVEADKYTDVFADKDYTTKELLGFRVKIGEKEGYCDANGKELVRPQNYTSVSADRDYTTKELLGFRIKIGEKEGYCDANGKELVRPQNYTSVSADRDYKTKELLGFKVNIGDKAGLLDKNGKVLVEPIKGSVVTNYDKQYKSFVVIEWDSQFKMIAQKLYSSQRKLIFESKTMKDMGVVSEGLIAIQENGLWGYMDVTNGKMVIPAQYTSADKFENGVAKVSKGNESFLISHPLKGKGSEVISSLSLGQAVHSDIDENIFESNRVEENTFAVVLSVQNYSGFVVPFATSDGKVFRQYCEKSLGIPKSNVMYYEDATLNNMHGVMSRIADLADAYEGDAKIIFYFAGQGMTDNAGNPYLLPSDASLNMIATTGYSVEKLYRELGGLDVQSAIVLLDAGFTNENREGKEITKSNGASVRTKNVPVTGKVAAVVAASEGESVYVNKDKGHGMFTYFLCKKIKESKGNVNLQELFDFVRINVVKTSKEKMNKTQTPQTISANSIILKNIKL